VNVVIGLVLGTVALVAIIALVAGLLFLIQLVLKASESR
jgi:hypothetical protein